MNSGEKINNNTENNLDISRFIGLIKAQWYWILISFVVSLLVAFIYIRYEHKVYVVSAKLLVNDEKKGGNVGLGNASGGLGDLLGSKNSVDNEVEILRTHDLMNSVVKDLNLNIKYLRGGRFKNTEIWESPYNVVLVSNLEDIKNHLLFELIINENSEIVLKNDDLKLSAKLNEEIDLPKIGKIKIVKNNQFSGDSFSDPLLVSLEPISKTTRSLQGGFSASVTNKTVSTIDLNLNTTLPEKGVVVLNKIIENYINQNLNDKNVVADSTLSFIAARLLEVSQELSNLESNITKYKKDNKIIDISSQANSLISSTGDISKDLAEIDGKISIYKELNRHLNGDGYRIVPGLALSTDNSLNNLSSQFNALLMEYERLKSTNTDDNANVVTILTQLDNLKSDMASNVNSNIKQLEVMRQQYKSHDRYLDGQLRRLPTLERGYFDMARMQQIKQEQYIFLQKAWEETAIGRTANVANAKLIDSPKVGLAPIAPKTSIIYLAAILIGILLPVGILYVKDMLNVKITNKNDIDSLTEIPIYGEIAHSKDNVSMVVTNTSRSPIAEQFRALRTNLDFSFKTNNAKSLMVTSTTQGEGKTFVALNLAISMSLLNKSVIFLELDLRRPSLLNKLNLEYKNGFTSFLMNDELKIEDVMFKHNDYSNLYFMHAGPVPPNPSELLINKKTIDLIEHLKERFDYVIVDTPPIGLVSDAQLIGQYVDSTIYVLRNNYTHKQSVHLVNSLNNENKLPNLALVVNDITAVSGSLYGYSAYGYGYGYGYYQQEESHKKGIRSIFKK